MNIDKEDLEPKRCIHYMIIGQCSFVRGIDKRDNGIQAF